MSLEPYSCYSFETSNNREKFMANRTFTGISLNGDFNEALSDAIQNAKEELETSYLEWELSKVAGKDGGVVALNRIEVNISVTATEVNS